MKETDKRRAVRQAVDVPRLKMPDLARLTGCSVASLRAYRTGYRIPSQTSAEQISAGLRSHALEIMAVADILDGIHGDPED